MMFLLNEDSHTIVTIEGQRQILVFLISEIFDKCVTILSNHFTEAGALSSFI